MKVKVNTKSDYRGLNGLWLEVKEIVGTRVTCIIKTELSENTTVDFNLKEVVEMNTIQIDEEISSKRNSLFSDIRDEMDADMQESGVAQGEIESCLNHWNNKYVILKKEWLSAEN